MVETDLFLQTVELIRAAGVSGDGWSDALVGLIRLFGSVGATLEIFDKRTISLLDFQVAGLPTGAETDYLDCYAMQNPRAAFAFQHLSKTSSATTS